MLFDLAATRWCFVLKRTFLRFLFFPLHLTFVLHLIGSLTHENPFEKWKSHWECLLMRVMTWSPFKKYKYIQKMWWREVGFLKNRSKKNVWGFQIRSNEMSSEPFSCLLQHSLCMSWIYDYISYHMRIKWHYLLKIRRHNIHKLNVECVSHARMYRMFSFCRKMKIIFFWAVMYGWMA